ncbi:PREDICTED: olfactomedin-4-like [Nanorana parkeri]|uniref:olfactomedin-4-like n=1 Tax=Nanorana parkeri TaxID=125878 RepID=UPI000854F779|nr:PREDICTED: olfactomedin-4-like [Nanorana parkeri]
MVPPVQSRTIEVEENKRYVLQNRIDVYQSTLTECIVRIKNLTKRVEIMENGGLSYNELDFEPIKLEIKEMETLILQLKALFDGSSAIIDILYQQIRNISSMVEQLEIYDKNNVLVIRREIEALKERLEECEKNNTKPNQPSLPPPDNGTGGHGGIISNISKPFVVQLNWAGSSFVYGGWGRDSLAGADQSIQWVAPLKDERMMETLRFYPSYNDLTTYRRPAQRNLTRKVSSNRYDHSNCGQGGGMIMYNNIIYYNCYNTLKICKYDWRNHVITGLALPGAAYAYANRFTYLHVAFQDIDLAGDEEGLWVIYSTEQNAGNMVISKLNDTTLEVLQTWHTSQYKPAVTNAFMVCGVLYATRAISAKQEEIFYMYDTKTNEEGKLNVIFDKLKERVQSLSYNPNDHRLYMYNDAYLVHYDLSFTSSSKPKSNIIHSRINPIKMK